MKISFYNRIYQNIDDHTLPITKEIDLDTLTFNTTQLIIIADFKEEHKYIYLKKHENIVEGYEQDRALKDNLIHDQTEFIKKLKNRINVLEKSLNKFENMDFLFS